MGVADTLQRIPRIIVFLTITLFRLNPRMNKNSDYQLTIEAGKAERHYWMDLWRYRELCYILAWRDIAVR